MQSAVLRLHVICPSNTIVSFSYISLFINDQVRLHKILCKSVRARVARVPFLRHSVVINLLQPPKPDQNMLYLSPYYRPVQNSTKLNVEIPRKQFDDRNSTSVGTVGAFYAICGMYSAQHVSTNPLLLLLFIAMLSISLFSSVVARLKIPCCVQSCGPYSLSKAESHR